MTAPDAAFLPAALRPRPGRLRLGHLLAGVAAGVVVAASIVVATRTTTPPAASPEPSAVAVTAVERAAFAAYAEGIDRAVEQGGAVVFYGMRPGVADIAEGAYADDVLIQMASGWLAELRAIRAEAAALRPPAFLASIAARFDDALAGYVRTAETLLAAARAGSAERAALIEQVSVLGVEADRLFDTAAEALGAERARLGLTPDRNHTGGSR